MVRVVGVEPTRLAAQEPKSCASANSTIPANQLYQFIKFFVKCQFLHEISTVQKRIIKKKQGDGSVKKKNNSPKCRMIRIVLLYLTLLPIIAFGWLYSRLPDRIYLEPGQTMVLPRFQFVEPRHLYGSQNAASTQAVGSYQTTLTLGGWLPIRNVRTIITERPYVTVCGTPFGVKMFSEGALIVGFSDLDAPDGTTSNPAKAAGLHLGDRVIRIGNTTTQNNEEVKEALKSSNGDPVDVIYIRNGEQRKTKLTPIWEESNGQWKAGMWVRDSSAGVGTMTFADEARGVFAGLGHPISDGDTGESIALRSGEIVPCQITGCSMGTIGSPGELKGKFLSSHAIGSIRINGENGVYGTTRTTFSGSKMEVAFAQEVETGNAEILTTVSGETPHSYRARIEKISDSGSYRNMVIRITDENLLKQTGGIVQGMSGSPIIQGGKLVGAVTHVLVNDPTRGYGIFAQTMLEQVETVAAMPFSEDYAG